ncbi:prepilin-type N-terminal cleavage/methylation domain-containing protein [Pelagicoccus sp. SDUM812003]|uniref:PilW family protein n=1 Tax=Pelagicoccus sp. SDUM812003 TaxID=3041267 RepID=UPI00280FE832|nr:prepilin-type N-terminal cleavage/methylation domain-containing protein [Pelagicoccus sp. SDUM812003]MDQ8201653.1 prepilin-type N-terminal cleavage/methylation domain-containing protein [Pelagicoccus sp. SDUM812003]
MTTTTAPSKSVFASERARKGFTLVEVLVAISLAGMILGFSIGSLVFLARTSQGAWNYQDMNTQSRFALESFASDARMTEDVNSISSSAVSLEVYNAAGGTTTVLYQFVPDRNVFVRVVGGVEKVLLNDVETLQLTGYTLRRATTLDRLEVKEIQLEAVMQRDVLTTTNTNEIISARFLMRNRPVSSG